MREFDIRTREFLRYNKCEGKITMRVYMQGLMKDAVSLAFFYNDRELAGVCG